MKKVKEHTDEVVSASALFKKNEKPAAEHNAKMLNVTLISAIIIFTFGFMGSLFVNTLSEQTYLYTAIVSICLILLISLKYVSKPSHIMAYVYIVYGVMILYATVTSTFFSSDMVGVTILAITFQFPVLYLDKSARINIASAISCVIYIIFVLRYKNSMIFADEILNILSFAALGMLIGTFTRRAQLENIDMRSTLREFAYTDQLTTLKNRRNFFETLAKIEDEASEEKILGFAMIDVDSFKKFNDTYGHQCGDDCLRKLGECFKKFEAEYGLEFFRYGGEEFVVINQSHAHSEFVKICNAFREDVLKIKIPCGGNETIGVSISVGTAEVLPTDNKGYESLLSRADIALYVAKNSGKNKLVTYSDSLKKNELSDEWEPSFRQRV